MWQEPSGENGRRPDLREPDDPEFPEPVVRVEAAAKIPGASKRHTPSAHGQLFEGCLARVKELAGSLNDNPCVFSRRLVTRKVPGVLKYGYRVFGLVESHPLLYGHH
jgi:hypothetical protein